VSALGVAYTRGLQGQHLTNGVLATAKHFVGYAVTEGGQHMAATAVGARELYDVYARPFEAAFRLAGLASVMPSYAEFDGVPISASKAVLTDMLRNRSVTLLKNDKGLLPLSRDIAKIAIIGPHADDVEAGFATYMYSTALKMMQARATGGDIAMAGVDLGGTPPPEAKAAMRPRWGRCSRPIAGNT
jgi:beta-glucosidase-like glycosyl hydrolase